MSASELDTVAFLAHDLRGPLAIIKGSIVQLLERSERYGPLTERQRELLAMTLRSSSLLEDLFRELESIARGGVDPRSTGRRPATIEEMLLAVGPKVLPPRSGEALTAELARGLPYRVVEEALERERLTVEIDPDLLGSPLAVSRLALARIVINLVKNAFSHAEPPYVLRLGRDGASDDLQLEVADSGPGLPGGVRGWLAGRAEGPELRANGRPVGLGLVSTRWLVERLGGRLEAHADGETRGTTMRVRLPVQEAEPPPTPA